MPNRTTSKHPWLNNVQYPFATREHDTGDGWMSYVDQGQGRPIVFVHGNPTWSYLYRHLIRDLSTQYRCVAPDHLGYGLSDKPRDADYRPEAQARRFAEFMDYLQLSDVTLVVQCAGGPIGLEWAMNNSSRVRDIVLFNTWMWPLDNNRPAQKLARLVGNPFNRVYYRMLKASPTFILPALFCDRHSISRPSRIQYLEPFRLFHERSALYGMIEGLTRSRGWFESMWDRRELLRDKPALFLWGTKDPMFGENSLHQLQTVFENQVTHRFERCGRYVPEEASRTAIGELRWFLMNRPSVAPLAL